MRRLRHSRRAGSALRLLSIVLFAVVAAHALHLPLLAHAEPAHQALQAVMVQAEHTERPFTLAHVHSVRVMSVAGVARTIGLDHHRPEEVQCAASPVTIPSRTALPNILVMLAAPPYVTVCDSGGAVTASGDLAEPARRHLLLQVLLR